METNAFPRTEPVLNVSWLTLRQAARQAQVCEATLRRELKAGRLRAVRVGGRRSWRVRPEWVDRWLEGASVEGWPLP